MSTETEVKYDKAYIAVALGITSPKNKEGLDDIKKTAAWLIREQKSNKPRLMTRESLKRYLNELVDFTFDSYGLEHGI